MMFMVFSLYIVILIISVFSFPLVLFNVPPIFFWFVFLFFILSFLLFDPPTHNNNQKEIIIIVIRFIILNYTCHFLPP